MLDSLFYTERSLDEQLAEGETTEIRVHQHVIVLWKPVARALGVSLLWAWYAFRIANPGRVLDAITLAVIAMWLWVLWREFERRHNWLVVTDKRLLKYEGLVSRTIPMMRLSKVTDLTYRRPIIGRILGYGTIVIESAGQDQAFYRLDYLPEPDTVFAMLNGALFGNRAKERAFRKSRRPWRRRRRDGGALGPDGGGPSGSGPAGGGDSGGNGPIAGGPSGNPTAGDKPQDQGLNAGGSGGSEGSGQSGGSGSSPAYEPWDPTDVPPAGYRPKPRRTDVGRLVDVPGESIYQSADLRRQGLRDADTGPIPIQQHSRRRRDGGHPQR